MADVNKIVKQNQEQAVASWINYLNQVRLERLMINLHSEEKNLSEAMATINATLQTIANDIVNNGAGRGGQNGMHGFIAEVAECGIENAREQIEGRIPICEWINDNGPEDLRRGATLIQQKFVNSGGHLSLQAIKNHLKDYPDFVDKGGVYQIPADHYEKIKWLLSMSENEADKMPTSSGDFSMRQWREVHDFFCNGEIPIDKIEPSKLTYSAVQKDIYSQTLNTERDKLLRKNEERRKQAYNESKPTLTEGTKTMGASAVIEGGMTLCMSIGKKRKSGKKVADFDTTDWMDIISESGLGTLKGGIRGISIYTLTNFTTSPAAVASAITTASFGIAEQIHLFRNGKLDEQSLIENSETLCLDASISAISSLAGQIVLPFPILGAVIGNTVGAMLYQIVKDNFTDKEQTILLEYAATLGKLDEKLEKEYRIFIEAIKEDMKKYMEVLDRAFVPDVHKAFEGSVELAKVSGVPIDEILDSKEKIDAFFLE